MDEPHQAVGTPGFEEQEDHRRSELPKLSVLLVGNYEPDGQQSMQRFAAVMAKELSAAGVDATVIRPELFFGRLHPGAGGIGKGLGYLDKFLVFPRRLKRRIRELQSEKPGRFVVHICDHSNAFYTRHLRGVPHLVTCHDLLAVRSALGEIPQNPTRWSGRILQKIVLHGLEGAGAIACVSEATHRDVLRLVKGAASRSTVTTIGLNAPFYPVPPEEARSRVRALLRENGRDFPRDARYLVHVGGNQWYKNRKGVLAMFRELHRSGEHPDLCLIMAGKPLGEELKAIITEGGIRDRVLEVSGVSHEDLCAIYSAAELLLFPSLQEGFGWPVIEAQACGCRVLTTARPPMSDIGGDAAAYLDPEDIPASLGVLLVMLRENNQERQARIDRGFANVARYSTEKMVRSYLAFYKRVASATS